MSDILKTAAIQLDISWSSKEENMHKVFDALSSLQSYIDIAVLPEMFTTGFICVPDDARRLAEPMDGMTLNTLRQWSQKFGMALCGSFIALEDDRVYNRAFFIDPSGDEYYYDKHHLFSISGEDDAYSPGTEIMPIFNFKGWNISMAVCFDLRFPAWLRNNNVTPYDLLIIMSNWPDSRVYAWKHLLIARAIENQAYVLGCNRSGSDNYGVYSGASMIIDPKGRPIQQAVDDNLCTGELSRSDLEIFRKKFPVLNETDRFRFSI